MAKSEGLPFDIRMRILAAIEQRILDKSQADQSQADRPIPELESLLQHRDRLRHAYTWPVDLGIVYRLLFYVVIPPLAWFGAALMETAVQEFLN